MAKLPLLRGKLERPAAIFLLPVLLASGFAFSAAADGEDAAQPAPAAQSAAPAAQKADEPAPLSSATDVQILREVKDAEAKPADAKPQDTKPQDTEPVAAAAKPAEPLNEEKASAKPSEAGSAAASNAGSGPAKDTPNAGAAATQPPAGTKAVAKPTEAKGSAKSADVKSDTKQTDAKASPSTALSIKPAAEKDAASGPKPKDLTPRADASESLVIQASSVNAVYNIHWIGANIGDLKLRSSITNRQYSLQATADISVFFGAVSWQGVTSSRGLMTANGPVPQSYSFRYATSDRHESIELRFQQRMVQDIIINPPAHPGPRNVPITAADLQNVVDPLSAVVLLSQARLRGHGGDACNKRIPIFDGKIRYDLVLSPKGTRTIGSSGKLHGTAYVCRVAYVPIAGHKAGKQNADYATGNTGIEVWLVPLPEAGLLVPYYIQVPTAAGTASLVTAKFDVETPGGRRALAD